MSYRAAIFAACLLAAAALGTAARAEVAATDDPPRAEPTGEPGAEPLPQAPAAPDAEPHGEPGAGPAAGPAAEPGAEAGAEQDRPTADDGEPAAPAAPPTPAARRTLAATGETAEPAAPRPDDAEAASRSGDGLPAAAARYYSLVEPVGGAPSPWIALAAGLDGGATVDGQGGWTALRVRVPVARRYGAVDARLVGRFDAEGLVSLAPEIVLRGVPLQLAGRRAALGFSFHFTPTMRGPRPLMFLAGGLMGGWLDRLWFLWAHVSVGAEVLQRGQPELASTLAFGFRLPRGVRPQVEVDLRWVMPERGEVALAVRPALRYWPTEWIGIGVSADIWAFGPEIESSAIRIDVVGHAPE